MPRPDERLLCILNFFVMKLALRSPELCDELLEGFDLALLKPHFEGLFTKKPCSIAVRGTSSKALSSSRLSCSLPPALSALART